MLGNVIDDSCNAETGEVIPGIGLLPITTTFTLSKHRTRARGIICSQSGMWEMLGEKNVPDMKFIWERVLWVKDRRMHLQNI